MMVSEKALRETFDELAFRVKRACPQAEFQGIALLNDGKWEVDYFDDATGTCRAQADRIVDIPEAVAANVERLSEAQRMRPPVPRVTAPPIPTGSFSKRVRKRDGACAVCGVTVGLHAHHIKPKAAYPALARDPGNGVALCAEHHLEAHRTRNNG